jgi:hypothetical protein
MAKQRVPVEQITRSVLILRGHRVLLDADLAALYGVSTSRLNQQVRRNWRRFPADFLFELTPEEHHVLKLQFATSKAGRGGRRKLPLMFTEHGAIMRISPDSIGQALSEVGRLTGRKLPMPVSANSCR